MFLAQKKLYSFSSDLWNLINPDLNSQILTQTAEHLISVLKKNALIIVPQGNRFVQDKILCAIHAKRLKNTVAVRFALADIAADNMYAKWLHSGNADEINEPDSDRLSNAMLTLLKFCVCAWSQESNRIVDLEQRSIKIRLCNIIPNSLAVELSHSDYEWIMRVFISTNSLQTRYKSTLNVFDLDSGKKCIPSRRRRFSCFF